MKTAIYVRLSEEDRNKNDKSQDSESIVNQRNMLTEYARERNWDIFDIYIDEDYSGSDATRPAFNKMIADARDGKFKIVLCKSLSRFARDVAMVETYINGLFLDWGIRFISLSDYADSSQKGTRKNIQINSLVNQWYLEDLSENIKSVMTHKKKAGQFVGSFAPYGYIKDPNDKHKLIIDPEAAQIVKRIFSMYLEGYGLSMIAKQFNAEGIPCPSKYKVLKGIKSNRSDTNAETLKWSDHTIWHITRNPNYTGDLVQCRYGKPSYKSKSHKTKPQEEWVVVENVHEPIINKEDYNRVQAMKKSRGAYSRSRKGSAITPMKPNAFAQLIKCKLCGRSMVMSTGGESNKFTRHFRCTGQKSRVVDCKCAMVKYDLIEEIIITKIKDLINQYCDFTTAEKRVKKSEQRYSAEIKNIEKSLEKNRLELQKLDTALTDSYIEKSTGAITADAFNAISQNLEVRKTELTAFRNSMQAKIDELRAKQSKASQQSHIAGKYADFSELTREIAGAFIDTIYIGERDREKYYVEPVGEYNRKTAKMDFYMEIVWNI
jgi:DNA invertase Pin-like site-specific DNA recombinase